MASSLGRTRNTVDETTTLHNAAGATGNGAILSLSSNDSEILVSMTGASAVLTVTHEVSFDGSNYVNAFLEDLLAAGGIGTLVNAVVNPTAMRYRYRIPPGATNFRSRISAFVSGTVTVTATKRTNA